MKVLLFIGIHYILPAFIDDSVLRLAADCFPARTEAGGTGDTLAAVLSPVSSL
jgi:hypothetical protein